MLTNGQADMAGARQNTISSNRSQDDATVGYFFQRPQNDSELSNYTNKRWAVGDDSCIIEQSRNVPVQELERDFHGLSMGREIPQKKIWDVGDEGKRPPEGKGMFPSPWTRDEPWSSNPGETASLGVNMVEYVLGGSPTNKQLDSRLRMKGSYQQDPGGVDGANDKKSKTPSPFEGVEGERPDDNKDVIQSNGILQNGLEEEVKYGSGRRNSRQNSPTGEDKVQQQVMNMPEVQKLQMKVENDLEPHPSLVQQPVGFQLDPPPFEPVGIDPVSFDYNNQLMPSMDSPNFNMDYSQWFSKMTLACNVQIMLVACLLICMAYGVCYALYIGLTPTAITPTPYVINAQDPYAVGIPIAANPCAVLVVGPAVIPQYYGVQAPWGLYPANLIQQQSQQTPQAMSQQQQQQMLRGQTGRPLTPSQQNDAMNNQSGQMTAQPLQNPNAQYQILAPAYYDQNGQLVMGNPRGIGTPVRLVSPAPVLVSAAANQQGGANALGSNPLRLLTTQAQQVQSTPPVVYSSNSYTPTSSLGYTQVSTSLFTPINSTNLSLNSQSNYGNSGLGSLGSSTGAIGSDEKYNSGFSGQRRDSLDYKQRQLTPLNQYYGSIGSMSGSPAGPMGLVQPGQSLTPPPSLSGSTANLTLGLGSIGRQYSAAPGAEAKFRNGSMGSAAGLFGGSSLFNNRNLATRSLSKEVTGRSRLLEDFRNNRIPNLQLKDLLNHVVEFSQDQHGSRFIQQKLERATVQEKAMVFTEILTAAYSLMTDVFGNYVIQKFFEFGTSEQKQTLAQRLRGHVLPLALQMYGCRVIQKALESIPADMQVEIVKELDGHVLKCVKDQNGNHVVQKCIECVEPKQLQFIIDAFKNQVYTLSTHPYGCRVIQRILEHCTLDQTCPILEELHEHTERLVQDQYGNYVIQHVLEHGRAEDKSKIVTELRGKVLLLSQHKFASNVVEKCVSHSSRQERAMLIEEVCAMSDGPYSALYTMMKDQFANYVVQKMIDIAETPQRKMLMHKIRPHIGTLRKFTYGKHILAKLEKFFLKNNPDLGPIGMPPNGALQ
ncbi:hypothetical protein ScPMuIL_009106 [Solemya velum]